MNKKKINRIKNNLFKLFGIVIIFVIAILIILPLFITFIYKNFGYTVGRVEAKPVIDNTVVVYNPTLTYDTDNYYNEENENMDEFEAYILRVVAAEMPISFELEALKAQAVAARTYAIKRIDNYNLNDFDSSEIGQACLTEDEIRERFGKNYDEYYAKLKEAIEETKGEILKYDEEPIEAVFHSTSAGITEYSENVWSESLPYLVSVESKEDLNAPNFTAIKEFDLEEIRKIIVDYFHSINIIQDFSAELDINIISRSSSGYVTELSVFGNKISGLEFRKLLGLRSTNFTIEKDSEKIIFTTRGYGHGVGMSQYGANFMAKEGSLYSAILLHYYKDVEVVKVY